VGRCGPDACGSGEGPMIEGCCEYCNEPFGFH